MFKTGVYCIEQTHNPNNLKTLFGNDKKISITLYNQLAHDVNKNAIAEKILLNFTDERGAFKRTYSNRFEEFDGRVLEEIQNHFSPESQVIFHDAAISDGRTAFDFFKQISPHFPHLRYYASDYDPYIYVIEYSNIKVVLNSSDVPIEALVPPFVLNLTRESLRYPFNRLLRLILKHTIVRKIVSQYKAGLLKADKRLIFCSKALGLSNEDTRFRLMQHDLLKQSPISEKVDIFRAMNILNRGYFTDDEFKIVIGQIFHALSEKGLFIAGSNQDSNTAVHGGIFLKENGKFQKIWQSGNGCIVEDMILNYRPS